MKFSKTIAAVLVMLSLLGAQHASAQSQALKSFSYLSTGCTSVAGAPLLQFGSAGNPSAPVWKMGLGSDMWTPGAGVFPTGNFYVRMIGITILSGSSTNWVMVGHSGPNGDWMNAPLQPGKDPLMVAYPSDTAPLFTAGEYFDAHVNSCDGSIVAFVSFWYVPAP